MTIVGVDISSRAIHLAWLSDGKPQRWHQDISGGKHDDELIDRLRRIRIEWPTIGVDHHYGPGHGVSEVAIEYPWARGNGVPALWAVMGVVTRQVPSWARVSWPTPGELRAAIGARNTKIDAHHKLWALALVKGWRTDSDWDEHELDALVACLGWTAILQAQDAA